MCIYTNNLVVLQIRSIEKWVKLRLLNFGGICVPQNLYVKSKSPVGWY